jgi:hypothetical protein
MEGAEGPAAQAAKVGDGCQRRSREGKSFVAFKEAKKQLK